MLQGVESVIVAFENKEGENAARVKASVVHLAIGGQYTIAVDMPLQAIEGLQNNPDIEYIEKDKLLLKDFKTTRTLSTSRRTRFSMRVLSPRPTVLKLSKRIKFIRLSPP
jgi:hypothetical protein